MPNTPLQSRLSRHLGRRKFIGGLSAFSALLGAEIVFGRFLPKGMMPVAIAEAMDQMQIEGKHPGLSILNDRPINAETPPHLLDDEFTPNDLFFIRNNGIPPEQPDAATWTLSIDGESVKTPKTFTLQELKSRFKEYTYALTLECGGNGRSEFVPAASGNQWTTGAVGCARWTGVRLADVLKDCGIAEDAVYIGYHAADIHLSRDPNKEPISRGVPINKALENESLIAWAMNGEDLPLQNGYPLRLVFGGWPASTSGKWLQRISIRDRVHDGAKMGGFSYRVPCSPVAPGATVEEQDMCIIESMPVKSLVTFPRSGISHSQDKALAVRGHAWAGDLAVNQVEVSIDFGQSWQPADLKSPVNRLAWQRWSADISFPKAGYYEVWARATDSNGTSQPMVLPGWNPKGYLNNACHRVAINVA